MAAIKALTLNFPTLPSSSSSRSRTKLVALTVNASETTSSALHFENLSSQRSRNSKFSLGEFEKLVSTRRSHVQIINKENVVETSKMYAILEAIADRIEMHNNIKDQRDNWNSLLLNSTNMLTLTATLAATLADGDTSGLKISSVILFSAATGILALMNKIQPSQLVEEQRCAAKLYKQLETRIRTQMALGSIPTETDVMDAHARVLAIDGAYPLPLLGKMLEKFPNSYEPARWWPRHQRSKIAVRSGCNGWNAELEEEMREIAHVANENDLADYERLGNKALKLSKALAVAGPALAGMAAVGAALAAVHQPLGGAVAGVCGSLAAVVSSVEHGGQVGMVVEMYRNCGGMFKELENEVESAVDEKRENGEVFELKMALRLGRSLSELRDLAARSKVGAIDEFASKLI